MPETEGRSRFARYVNAALESGPNVILAVSAGLALQKNPMAPMFRAAGIAAGALPEAAKTYWSAREAWKQADHPPGTSMAAAGADAVSANQTQLRRLAVGAGAAATVATAAWGAGLGANRLDVAMVAAVALGAAKGAGVLLSMEDGNGLEQWKGAVTSALRASAPFLMIGASLATGDSAGFRALGILGLGMQAVEEAAQAKTGSHLLNQMVMGTGFMIWSAGVETPSAKDHLGEGFATDLGAGLAVAGLSTLAVTSAVRELLPEGRASVSDLEGRPPTSTTTTPVLLTGAELSSPDVAPLARAASSRPPSAEDEPSLRMRRSPAAAVTARVPAVTDRVVPLTGPPAERYPAENSGALGAAARMQPARAATPSDAGGPTEVEPPHEPLAIHLTGGRTAPAAARR
ncbi:hypothetical protein [Streptomyces cyaneofuscatus]|uniref:hypothetical protein n=1 Tax=Streptomyces cyaneofuscatus TaxID=66883 RepID=UPI0033BBE49C